MCFSSLVSCVSSSYHMWPISLCLYYRSPGSVGTLGSHLRPSDIHPSFLTFHPRLCFHSLSLDVPRNLGHTSIHSLGFLFRLEEMRLDLLRQLENNFRAAVSCQMSLISSPQQHCVRLKCCDFVSLSSTLHNNKKCEVTEQTWSFEVLVSRT